MARMKKIVATLLTMIMLLTFIPTTANAATRGWKKSGKYWTYIMPSGKKAKGWKKINKKWYYFNKKYQMVTGLQKISKKYYYFTSKGVMKTGWVKIDKKKHYFDVRGDMLKNSWVDAGTAFYYVDEEGIMVKNTSRKIGKNVYLFGTDGKKIESKGWHSLTVKVKDEEGNKQEVENWYYLKKGGIAYTSCWKKIEGIFNYFDENGICTIRTYDDPNAVTQE